MSSAVITRHEANPVVEQVLNAHVVYLTNFITPYNGPVYVELAKRVRKLTILLSTPMEPNRHWKPDFADLDVRVLRTWTFSRLWRHPIGFREKIYLHIPWNTTGTLRELRPDVVLSSEFGARSILGAVYTMFAHKPLVLAAFISEHQEQGRGFIRWLLRKWLIDHSTTIVVNGQSGARYLYKMGANPHYVFHVPYTHVPNYFENIPTERSPEVARRLLYVGQLVERKGLRPFFCALGEWATRHPDRTVDFDLAGSGPLAAELRAIPLPSNVNTRFLGERTISELVECYAQAGILVFPTLSDEWGLVTNEALAAGLPVLGSTYAQSVEELCIEGKSGWRFRTNVPEELAGAIDRAMNTPLDKLQEMRWTGHRLVSKLTPAYGADRLVESIKAALESRRGT